MPKLTIDKRKEAILLRALRAIRRRARRATGFGVGAAGQSYLRLVVRMVSVPAIEGSPQLHYNALARMDHPYAERHGSIQIRPAGGPTGIPAELLVHEVEGELRAAISGDFRPSFGDYTIRVDEGKAPHARAVIEGTEVMLPRDFLHDPLEIDFVRRQLFKTTVGVARLVFAASF